MSYHDELLEQAVILAQLNLPKHPNQADLRRAVSSAYYSLFHFLTGEAAQSWKHERHRNQITRSFSHGRMKAASESFGKRAVSTDPAQLTVKIVANLFVEMQNKRHDADYDNTATWGHLEVSNLIQRTQHAMASWASVRDEPLAQDYLFELFDFKAR